MNGKQKRNLLVVAIDRGLITLINEVGAFEYYAQRGIRLYNNEQRRMLINANKLNPATIDMQELPRNIQIRYECPEIQGKAYVTYNPNRK